MRIATGTAAGIVKAAGLATSKETVPVVQCFSHRPPSLSICAFICAMAAGSATGPGHAYAAVVACAKMKAAMAKSAKNDRARRGMVHMIPPVKPGFMRCIKHPSAKEHRRELAAAQPKGVGDDRDRAEAHRHRRDHRRKQQSRERIK